MNVGKDICAVILAAGLGTRLMPLTAICPKALVPVGNVPLLERGLERLAAAGFSGQAEVAVNAHHHSEKIVQQVGERAHLSLEKQAPLGSAGAVGRLREWIDGRAVLVLNADAYVSAPQGDLLRLLHGWDGERVRLLGRAEADGHPPLGGLFFAGASLLPAADALALTDEFSHLVQTTWRPADRAGRLDAIELDGTYIDCGTPADYLAANLHAAHGENLIDPTASVSGPVRESVIGARARVAGVVRRSVVWPDTEVAKGEALSDVIRAATGVTVEATGT